MLLNENVTVLPESGISVKKRIDEFLTENPSATLIRLDQSLMNLSLPSVVTEGMKRAIEEVSSPFGDRLSSPWSGYEALKKAVVARLEGFGVKVPESDVFIISGLESAYAGLSGLFARGNNVILPSPCSPSLLQMEQCEGRNISYARATPENGFSPEPDASPADLIYLSSPSALTGVAHSRENLEKWVSYANENAGIIIYDTSLSDYIEGEEFPRSIYEIEGARSCAIEVFSFEIGYGVKELKVGYVIIPSSLSRDTVRIRDLFCARQPSFASPPSFVMQKAAELLFSGEAGPEKEKMIRQIKNVARILSDGLSLAGFAHTGGENSPFIWAQCPDAMGSWQCFDKLMQEAGCVVTPGSLFGYGGEGYFRMTAFATPEEAENSVEKIKNAFSAPPAVTPEEKEADTAALLFEEREEDGEEKE